MSQTRSRLRGLCSRSQSSWIWYPGSRINGDYTYNTPAGSQAESWKKPTSGTLLCAKLTVHAITRGWGRRKFSQAGKREMEMGRSLHLPEWKQKTKNTGKNIKHQAASSKQQAASSKNKRTREIGIRIEMGHAACHTKYKHKHCTQYGGITSNMSLSLLIFYFTFHRNEKLINIITHAGLELKEETHKRKKN